MAPKFHYSDGTAPHPGFKPSGSVVGLPDQTLTSDDIPSRQEQARSGPAGVKLPAFLPWYDDPTGKGIPPAVLRKMIQCPYIKSALFAKVIAVAALDLKVHPATKKSPKDKAVAAFVKWNLTERLSGGITDLTWNLLVHACIDGHSVNEMIPEQETQGTYKGKTVVDEIKPKQVGDDVVLKVDEFRNVTSIMGLRYNAGKEFDPQDFLIYRHMPLYNVPTGSTDLSACYAAYWALDTAAKLRLLGLNRASLGVLLGTYKTGPQKTSLEQALAKISTANWGSVPEGVKIDVLNLAASSKDVFESAEKKLIHEIFLAIRFSYLMQLEGTVSDGAGSSQVHASSADQLVLFLATTITALLNNRKCGLVKWLVDQNYVVDEYPRVTLSCVDPNQQTLRMAIYTSAHALGKDISQEQFGEEMGIEAPLDDADTLKGKAADAPASPGGGEANPLAPKSPFSDGISVLTQPVKTTLIDGDDKPITRERQTEVAAGVRPGGVVDSTRSPHEHAERPAAGVAGVAPFRFSDSWEAYLNR